MWPVTATRELSESQRQCCSDILEALFSATPLGISRDMFWDFAFCTPLEDPWNTAKSIPPPPPPCENTTPRRCAGFFKEDLPPSTNALRHAKKGKHPIRINTFRRKWMFAYLKPRWTKDEQLEWFWTDSKNKGASLDYIHIDLLDDVRDEQASPVIGAKSAAVDDADAWSRWSASVYNLYYAVYLARRRLLRRLDLPPGVQRPMDPSATEIASFVVPRSFEQYLQNRRTPEDVLILESLGRMNDASERQGLNSHDLESQLKRRADNLSEMPRSLAFEAAVIGLVLWKSPRQVFDWLLSSLEDEALRLERPSSSRPARIDRHPEDERKSEDI
ncbi:uncharacterized protein J7T54_007663 [Emericellopsis cladophorae]|uniref:Uncharacterized protein n=1 Tax=Emericellopsis cladophorae TaxID=2686198 RepID=A0A9Q0BB24_9HYPO|nr:uncharacterized protein J7T54_007663 [Emericellopsis cladophorae]KAI6778055.1 hypothetical protein J7T54_007663 [Emericellopsis cladophorae]